MPQTIKILIVEDNDRDAELLVRELYRAGFDAHWLRVETEDDYLNNLNPDLDLILADCDMSQFGSLRALELLKQRGLEIPFVIVSGPVSVETAVKVMQEGAAGYLLKEQIARLGPVVNRSLKKAGEPIGHSPLGQKSAGMTENL